MGSQSTTRKSAEGDLQVFRRDSPVVTGLVKGYAEPGKAHGLALSVTAVVAAGADRGGPSMAKSRAVEVSARGYTRRCANSVRHFYALNFV
jgi:hypothetical protein